MKKIFFLLATLLLVASACSQNQDKKYTILLTGASFAAENNGWFELACQTLNAEPINRAVAAEAIVDAANRMDKGTLYSKEELENIDVFVIMQVHNMDVFEDSKIRQNYTDYPTPFDRTNYAAPYDYVIKRYMAECYNLKFDKSSKYYGSEYGKPAIIVLCTHWHDGRPVFNASVRKLAAKWGFPLVEFDENIGFSKNQRHPVTGDESSLVYARDKEEIDGKMYGWHPEQGQDKYIQRRMASIFIDEIKKILPL